MLNSTVDLFRLDLLGCHHFIPLMCHILNTLNTFSLFWEANATLTTTAVPTCGIFLKLKESRWSNASLEDSAKRLELQQQKKEAMSSSL